MEEARRVFKITSTPSLLAKMNFREMTAGSEGERVGEGGGISISDSASAPATIVSANDFEVSEVSELEGKSAQAEGLARLQARMELRGGIAVGIWVAVAIIIYYFLSFNV